MRERDEQTPAAPADGAPPGVHAAPAHGHDASEGAFDPAPYRPRARGLVLATLAMLAAIAGAVTLGVRPRNRPGDALRASHAQREGGRVRVLVVHPTRPARGAGISLPGTVEPMQEAEVFARTAGYVRRFEADLGDAVREGQLLATIDTPEATQELRQARAALLEARARLAQVRAQHELASTRAQRYTALAPSGVVSQQEADDSRGQVRAQGASVEAAQAAVASSEANVRRLEERERYAAVRAPFDGVITARNVDVGQLVSGNATAAQPLFRVSKTDVVRVFVNVPQAYVPSVRVGGEAVLLLRERPGHPFRGSVVRTARSLDAATRTMRVEVQLDNHDGALFAGMYAQVTLAIERATPLLTVPATALETGVDGTRVAVVEQGVLRWRAVQVDADLGDRVAVSEGLREGDWVASNPSDRLVEGQSVEPYEAPVTARGEGAHGAASAAPAAGRH